LSNFKENVKDANMTVQVSKYRSLNLKIPRLSLIFVSSM